MPRSAGPDGAASAQDAASPDGAGRLLGCAAPACAAFPFLTSRSFYALTALLKPISVDLDERLMSAIAPETPEATLSATPARACAFAVLRRVFEQDAWADRALHGEARRLRLDPRDRALATQLAYGAVQRRATLDALIEALAARPPQRLEPAVLAGLRLGAFQLAYLDRIPAHAAVGESVELAKADSPGGARLVNAVLRRAAREARAWLATLSDATPADAALTHSHPEWIARLWWEALGPDAARALMAADNEAAEGGVRANTLR